MSTPWAIRHTTSFEYDSPVAEAVMELRMRPATDGLQQCMQFAVDVQPKARLFEYRDFLGNAVHHFDIPGGHQRLTIIASSHVQCEPPPALPASLPAGARDVVAGWADRGEHWHFRQPSHFAAWTPALIEFASSIGAPGGAGTDPLVLVRDTMAAIHRTFEYAPASTRVDSPIDDALTSKRGVCQDFAHVMISVLRHRGMPARYVSGYVAPGAVLQGSGSATVATHAWVEVLLPDLGWVGVDPTHNVPAGPGHVRVAIGRDYADVPPTRGTFKGKANGTLSVAVNITRGGAIPAQDRVLQTEWHTAPARPAPGAREQEQQQQQ